ncbi:hypothetical protein RND81_06G109600 [Saponaria officinalis]|uniref:Uncharacterized protein n=1 Tax=Saponaria officinalis TaxID=3572 RepID=A0AAW1KA91_SAPOF
MSLTTTFKLLSFVPIPTHRTTIPNNHRKFPFTVACFSIPPPSAAAQAVAQAEANNCLPCVRTYENDLGRLSLTGFVDFQQALTAASADGGLAADEHLESGLDVMAVETVFPGPTNDLSTMSTRLFLPARKVKEKARRLRRSLSKDIFSGTSSMNILAMTFRQVVVQQVMNFDLAVFVPGSQRNMNDLGSQREVTVSFALSSSDESIISGLAEVFCSLALESTQSEFQQGSGEKASDGFFHWFSKNKKFASKDSSVTLYKIEDGVIVENAISLLDIFNSSRENSFSGSKKPTISAWESTMHSRLEKIGGLEFSKWASEHVPAYKLEINADRGTNITFEGWKTSGNQWEVLLTHSQMVALVDVLDMYFEDVYSLPNKKLSCEAPRSPKNLLKNKRRFSLLGFARNTVVVAIILISVSVMIKLFLPHVYSSRRINHGGQMLSSSENDFEKVQLVTLEASQLESYCSALVKILKGYYNWNGDVKFDPIVGAWVGEIPTYLRNGHVANSIGQDVIASSDIVGTSDDELNSSLQEIASYQVLMSTDGRVVGFQPTSRVAVNHWASNPIAKELYGGKELSPGLLEPGLNIKKPDHVIVLELLMSLRQENYFALARLVQ